MNSFGIKNVGVSVLVVALVMLVLLSCVGCESLRSGETGSSKTEGDGSGASQSIDHGIDMSSMAKMFATTPEHISVQAGENLKVDADVEVPAVGSYPVVSAAPVRFDEDAESIQKTVFDSTSFTTETHEIDFGDYEFEPGTQYISTTTDGRELTISPGSLSLSNPLSGLYNFSQIYQPTNSLKEPYFGNDLSFATPEEAVQQANAYLDALGIKYADDPEVCSLTAEALNEEKRKILEPEENPELTFTLTKDEIAYEFTKDDECYVLFYKLDFEGIPVTKTVLDSRTISIDYNPSMGSLIRVEISKEGVIGFSVDNAYELISQALISEQLISVDDALNKLRIQYDPVLTDKKININHISLEYCPTQMNLDGLSLHYTPTWVFVNQDEPDYSLRVNAIDGTIF